MNEKQSAEFLRLAEKNLASIKNPQPTAPSFSDNVGKAVDALYDIPVQVTAVLGKATLPVNSLLKMDAGSVIELDKKVGDRVDIYVNNKLIAYGELVAEGDKLGVSLTEIIQ